MHGFGNDDTNTGSLYTNADIRVGTSISDGVSGTSLSGVLIEQNVIGVGPSSLADPGANNRSLNGIGIYGPDGGIIQDNVIASAGQFGIFVSNDADGWTIQRNDIRENGRENNGRDGMDVGNFSGGALISQNYIFDNAGSGIDSWQSAGGHTITNNTIDSNGSVGGERAGMRLFGTGTTVTLNRIQNSAGPGVMIVADPQWASVNFPSNGNRITQNSFSGNGANAIDLLAEVPGAGFADANAGDGITANDGATNANSGNRGVDTPVITSAAKVGATTTISGTAGTGVTSVEVYRAVAGAGDTSGAYGYGEGAQYLGTAAVVAGNWTLDFVDGAITLNQGEYVSAIGITAANDTSEFSRNFGTTTISGTVYHDVDGDADVAEGGTLTFSGATVRLFVDDGDGAIDAGDTLLATTTTDGAGAYTFSGLGDATYWVTVDSTTLTSGAAFNAAYNATWIWAEQTYGDDSTTGGAPDLAARYGGRNANISDAAVASDPVGSEHVARAVVSGGGVAGVNFGFSFNAVVTTDDGDDAAGNRTVQGSLRQFIQNANAIANTSFGGGAAVYTSNFSIGGGGAQSIALTAALANITDTVILDATTQEGFATAPLIELNGTSAGAAADGLTILGASANGSTIRGFVINRFGDDNVVISGSSNNVVAGNYLGTNAAGTADQDTGGDGVQIDGASTGNTIGGTVAADRNVISGNAVGVRITGDGADSNSVRGNLIGTNFDGSAAVANSAEGVRIEASADLNTIGGSNATFRNVISGNAGNGTTLTGAATDTNDVRWNYIGVNAAGNATLGNGGDGILIADGSRFGDVYNNTIGGNQDGIQIDGTTANQTAGNIVRSNYVGTDSTLAFALGNAQTGLRIVGANAISNNIGGNGVVLGNWFYNNASDGIRVEASATGANRFEVNRTWNNGGLGINLVKRRRYRRRRDAQRRSARRRYWRERAVELPGVHRQRAGTARASASSARSPGRRTRHTRFSSSSARRPTHRGTGKDRYLRRPRGGDDERSHRDRQLQHKLRSERGERSRADDLRCRECGDGDRGSTRRTRAPSSVPPSRSRSRPASRSPARSTTTSTPTRTSPTMAARCSRTGPTRSGSTSTTATA